MPLDDSVESDVRHLHRENSLLNQELRALERTVGQLRQDLYGTDGKSGIIADVRTVVADQKAVQVQQKANNDNLRLAVWYPSIVSTLALIVAIISLAVAFSN